MKKLFRKLKNLKDSKYYLVFIIFCFIGCVYQVFEVSDVYFKYKTEIDIKIDTSSQIVVPMVSFCKKASQSLKKPLTGRLTPANMDRKTWSLSEVFFHCSMLNKNLKYNGANNCNLKKYGLKYEKTVNGRYVCYHFKHPQFNDKDDRVSNIIYSFMIYHFRKDSEILLYLTSENSISTGESWNSINLIGIQILIFIIIYYQNLFYHYLLLFTIKTLKLSQEDDIILWHTQGLFLIYYQHHMQPTVSITLKLDVVQEVIAWTIAK